MRGRVGMKSVGNGEGKGWDKEEEGRGKEGREEGGRHILPIFFNSVSLIFLEISLFSSYYLHHTQIYPHFKNCFFLVATAFVNCRTNLG